MPLEETRALLRTVEGQLGAHVIHRVEGDTQVRKVTTPGQSPSTQSAEIRLMGPFLPLEMSWLAMKGYWFFLLMGEQMGPSYEPVYRSLLFRSCPLGLMRWY